MNFLLRIAIRNVLRQKFRTTLSALVVMSGVWVLIVGQGFIGGLRENVIRASIDSMTGHVSLRPPEYPDAGFEHPIDNLIELTPERLEVIEQTAEEWTTRTFAIADAISYPHTLRVKLIGFDPVRDPTVFPRKDWKVNGAMPGADSVLLSSGVARLCKVGAGDVGQLYYR